MEKSDDSESSPSDSESEVATNRDSFSSIWVSGDYTIPARTTILIGQFLIHWNEEFHKDPLKFDPDNFLPAKCQKRPYCANIPFSAGPRSCVGRKYAMLELKVLLAGVLREFEIHSDEKEDFRLQGDIILRKE
ncbi:hypothetical protein JTB14_022737 [Gonioctena quinquepunctata]|nr:hypothetical protein JTB14_022737 [Gonioctena quinquepunctata]